MIATSTRCFLIGAAAWTIVGCEAHGQMVTDEWTRQGPSPTDMNITDIDFDSSDRGWVTASYASWGGLFGTSDGGASWKTIILDAFETFNTIDMLDQTHGWVAGSAIYKTENAWDSWTRSNIPDEPTGNPNAVGATQVQFIDGTVGYLSTRPSLTFSYLYRTSDGGNSWNYLGRFDLDSWRFADANIGWAALEDHTFVRTNDGGQTWSPVPMPPTVTIQSDVLEVFSYDHAVVTTFQDTETRFSIHQTTNAGQTWESSSPGTPRDAVFTDPQHAFGFMQFGAPAVTTDGGMSWTVNNAAQIDHDYFTAIDVVGHSIFLGGEFGFVAASHDSGASWSQISSGSGNDLRRVGFATALDGWVSGGGTILHTTDGGDTWKHQPGPSLTPFQAIFSTGPSDVYPFSPDHAAMRWNRGNLIITNDGGENWVLADQNESWPGGRIYVGDPGVYYKFNLEAGGPKIYKTADGGTSWSSINANIPYVFDAGDIVYDFYFHDDLNGWIVGSPNIALRTQDGGLTWDRTPNIVRLPRPVYRRVRFATPETGWIIGSYGLILRTTDGGDTWEEQTVADTFDATYTDIVVVSENEAYLCGHDELNRDIVRRTTDGGLNWTIGYTPGLAHPFTDFQSAHNGLAVVDGNVWAVGIWGGIVHKRSTACRADLAEPFGVLDFFDVMAFLDAFFEQNSVADFTGDEVFDVFDVIGYLGEFESGCP